MSDYDEDEDSLEEPTNPDPPSSGPKGRALAEIRHKLEHNFFSRSDLCDKLQIFETLNDCLDENQGEWGDCKGLGERVDPRLREYCG